jgi:hypothetical protein
MAMAINSFIGILGLLASLARYKAAISFSVSAEAGQKYGISHLLFQNR